jgi:hypothetical protein
MSTSECLQGQINGVALSRDGSRIERSPAAAASASEIAKETPTTTT